MSRTKIAIGALVALLVIALIAVSIILGMRGPEIVVVADARSCNGVYERNAFPATTSYTLKYEVIPREIEFKGGVVSCLGREETSAVVRTYTAKEWMEASKGKEVLIVGGAECGSDVFVQLEPGSPRYKSLMQGRFAVMLPFSTRFRCGKEGGNRTLEVKQVDDLSSLDNEPGVVYMKFMTAADWSAALSSREYLIVTGFDYARCDGVYKLDPDRENRMMPQYVQHTGDADVEARRAVVVPFDPNFKCLKLDGTGYYGERAIVDGTPGVDEVKVRAMSKRDWEAYMANREIVFISGYNYATCDGMYVADAPGSINYTRQGYAGEDPRKAVIIPGLNRFNCQRPDGVAFGPRDVLYPATSTRDPVQIRTLSREGYNRLMAANKYIMVTGYSDACDGVYDLQDGDGAPVYIRTDATSHRSRRMHLTPFDQSVVCYKTDLSAQWGRKDVVRFTGRPDAAALAGKVGVQGFAVRPQSKRFARIQGFNYAACDGIYELRGNKYVQIIDQNNDMVSDDAARRISGLNEYSLQFTCNDPGESGSFGSRTIVESDPVAGESAMVDFADDIADDFA